MGNEVLAEVLVEVCEEYKKVAPTSYTYIDFARIRNAEKTSR